MKNSTMFRGAFVIAAGIALSGQLGASTIYYTNFSGRQIRSLDTVTKATTLVDSVPVAAGGNPDSLIFDSTGRIVYTIYNGSPGEVRIFDPIANTDTLLATGFSSQLVDVTLEPSLNTILVSDRGNNSIDRVNLTTGTVTLLGSAGAFGTVDGLTYDASGNLYAAVNTNIVKINPITGAVITTGASTGVFLDGLTYDSVSNKLWAATGSCIYNFDLVTLAPSACIATPGFGGNDGIESDGAGHLFIAASSSALVAQYTISSGTFLAVSNNLGSLDDIAPTSGLGAPPSAPEPAGFVLVSGGLGLLAFLRRKKA
jgi:streptogramin lyase